LSPANNLPLQTNTFIGRAQELAQVRQLLTGARLLNLTGAGGAGKTRLALEAVAGLPEEYLDGAWLVELAPLADPALVPQTVASVLRVRETAGSTVLDKLTGYLRDKSLLLVLDNCEHVVEVMAHLQARATRRRPRERLAWKERLTFRLYERGHGRQDILELFGSSTGCWRFRRRWKRSSR
jgi:predicted ATPase